MSKTLPQQLDLQGKPNSKVCINGKCYYVRNPKSLFKVIKISKATL